MSGTSMDGIDAALVDFENNQFIKGITCPYSPSVKKKLEHALTVTSHTLGYFSQINTLLGREFANAALELLNTANYRPSDIIAIGSHGQTLCHDATAAIPYTVQLGCAHTIAELTGITVVADFRTRDLVVGGQGGVFALIYHQDIFNQYEHPLAVVNIGGIANLTYLEDNHLVTGYDLGPGNSLMDAWVLQHLNKAYDEAGMWAETGQVIVPLLNALLDDDYFKRKAPKSVGKEYFSLTWLKPFLSGQELPEDVQATLLQLTAVAIADGIKRQSALPHQLLLCGGGAHNEVLLKALALLLPELHVNSTKAVGMDPDYIEASMFAWFAEKTLNGIQLDLSGITGARYSTILGAIYPSGIDKRNWLEV